MEIPREQLERAKENLERLLRLLGLEATVQADFANNCVELTVDSQEPGRIIGRKGRTLSAMQLLINSMMHKDSGACPRVQIAIADYEPRGRQRGRGDQKPSGPAPSRKDEPEKAAAEARPAEPPQARQDQPQRPDRPPERQPQRPDRPPERQPRRGPESPRGGSQPREKRPEADPERPRIQALDAAKEVKRWGEEVSLPPMSADECQMASEALKDDSELEFSSGEELPNGKKRITIRLKATDS